MRTIEIYTEGPLLACNVNEGQHILRCSAHHFDVYDEWRTREMLAALLPSGTIELKRMRVL